MQHIRPKSQSAKWLAAEMLKRTDLSTGDICMFHYPVEYFPCLEVDDIARAFTMIFEGGVDSSDADYSAPEVRNQITRVQFSWYQFEGFPQEVVGRTYVNLQHLEIRQNASLTSIDSLISQLPLLRSLNVSDCPNIRTLAPLATALLAAPPQQREDGTEDNDDSSLDGQRENMQLIRPTRRRSLSLRHLWVRGCDLSDMSSEEWSSVFDALSESSGPLERLSLSRNNISYLHGGVGKLKHLIYLFVEDNASGGGGAALGKKGFNLPDEVGDLSNLRFVSFSGNNVTALPRTMGRLRDDCGLYLHRNPNLMYPPPEYQRSIPTMRHFFHQERMALLWGVVLFVPHCKRARHRANERLYKPGGRGYMVCKERFEESARKASITMMNN